MQTNSAHLNKTILMATYDIVVAYTQNMPHGTDLAEVTRSVGEALRQSTFALEQPHPTQAADTKVKRVWTEKQRKSYEARRKKSAESAKLSQAIPPPEPIEADHIKMGFAWRTPAYFYGTGNYVAPKF